MMLCYVRGDSDMAPVYLDNLRALMLLDAKSVARGITLKQWCIGLQSTT